jgi:LPS-assembly lipoprotein
MEKPMNSAQSERPWVAWQRVTAALLALSVLVMAGCGFQLRGSANIPFETIAISGAENTPFHVELRRNIMANRNVRVLDDAKLAQAILQVTGISQERRILSLSGAGRVREFQLVYRVSFRVHDGKGRELLPPNDIVLRRDITFNDSQVLAKEQEEILLVRDMQSDAVQQVLRRLSTAKLAAS